MLNYSIHEKLTRVCRISLAFSINRFLEVKGTQIMQNSCIFESEKDTNYLHDIAIDKELDQGLLPNGCVEKKVHQFYFVKFRPCEDQNVKYRIEEVKQLLEKINQEQLSMNEKLRTKQVRMLHCMMKDSYDA